VGQKIDYNLNQWRKGFSFFPEDPSTDFAEFRNVKAENDRVKTRKGRAKYLAISASGTPVNGLYSLTTPSFYAAALQILIAFKDGTVYKSLLNWATGAAWTAITGSLGTYDTGTTYPWEFAEYYNAVGKTLFCTNGNSLQQKIYFDGSITFANLKITNMGGSPPTSAKHICEYNSYMILAGGNWIECSAYDSPETGYGTLNRREVGRGSEITGIFSIGGDLIIAKEDSFYYISGVPTESPILEAVAYQGCPSPRSLCLVGSRLFYYFDQAIWEYPIRKIAELRDDNIVNPQNIVITRCGKENLLLVYLCDTLSPGTNDTMYYLDIEKGTLARDLARPVFLSSGFVS